MNKLPHNKVELQELAQMQSKLLDIQHLSAKYQGGVLIRYGNYLKSILSKELDKYSFLIGKQFTMAPNTVYNSSKNARKGHIESIVAFNPYSVLVKFRYENREFDDVPLSILKSIDSINTVDS